MSGTKRFFLIAAAGFFLLIPGRAFSFLLPNCTISADERTVPAEEVLKRYREERSALASKEELSRLAEYARNPKIRLSEKERSVAGEYHRLSVKIGFWEYVANLKQALDTLPGNNGEEGVREEADAIAKIIVDRLYALSQQWRVGNSAFVRNFLIHIGKEQKGYCYHYADELRKALLLRSWHHFALHWGTAHRDKKNENNALVITAGGAPFEDGLMIDAWRKGGRPYFAPASRDFYPWKEDFDVVIE